MKHIYFLSLLLLSGGAFALETPHGGPYDKRVRNVDYKPEEVVKIVAHYGYVTHIQFGAAETIDKAILGDEAAWSITPIRNHLYIKPVGEDAATNMTVLTNRHAYNFELSAHWSQNGAHPRPNDMMFQIAFRYPLEEAALKKQLIAQQDLTEKLNESPKIQNWNYWVKGSSEITPSSAYDDGRFLYLKFPRNQEMPAVYIEGSDGSESLVNTDVRGNTIVVHKVAKRYVLRKGKAVVGIFNQSFDPNGISTQNGTTSPDVKRVIIGGRS